MSTAASTEITPAYVGGTDGTPMVLLHGITGSWRIWRPVLPALEAEHNIYVPTLPGHRGGSALADDFDGTAEMLADLIEAQLDAEGIETAHVVGNSLGGWVALLLARRGRARSVVVFSPAGAWRTRGDLKRVVRMLSLLRASLGRIAPRIEKLLRRPGFRKLAFGQTVADGSKIPATEIGGLVTDVLECTIFDTFMAAVVGTDSLPTVPSDVPTRIAWGKKDKTLPFRRYGEPMVAAVPGAELVMLDGVGHVPMYDDPELVARTVLEFVRPIDATAGATTTEATA